MKLALLWVLSVLLTATENVHCSKILTLMTVPSHSHHLWNMVYIKALLKRGHHVTYLGVDDFPNPPANLTYIQIEKAYDIYANFDFTEVSDLDRYSSLFHLYTWYDDMRQVYNIQNGFKKFVDVIKKEKFDLVVYDLATSAYLLGAVDVLGRPPIIGLTAFGVPAWAMDYSGTPYPVQNDPFFLLPYPKDMTFLQRLENSFFYATAWFVRHEFLAREEEESQKVFGPGIRSLKEIEDDININIVNHNKATDNPFPATSGLIPIAGTHIAPVKPLPKDIKEYLDSSPEGVIYFSLGSNIQSAYLHEAEISALTSAFKRLAPIKVLWKWEKDELPGKPDNVRIGKWLPQSDILSHPNVRLFFTHGGMLSSQEGLYYGIPIVGMPIFLDQHVNIKKAVLYGYGEALSLKGLTSDAVVTAITKVIKNPSYKKTAKRLSTIFRDHLVAPLDEAVYWSEYAIRHNGAKHLRPASKNLNWFQAGLYDVLLAYLCLLLIICHMIVKVIRTIINLVFGSKPKVKKQ